MDRQYPKQKQIIEQPLQDTVDQHILQIQTFYESLNEKSQFLLNFQAMLQKEMNTKPQHKQKRQKIFKKQGNQQEHTTQEKKEKYTKKQIKQKEQSHMLTKQKQKNMQFEFKCTVPGTADGYQHNQLIQEEEAQKEQLKKEVNYQPEIFNNNQQQPNLQSPTQHQWPTLYTNHKIIEQQSHWDISTRNKSKSNFHRNKMQNNHQYCSSIQSKSRKKYFKQKQLALRCLYFQLRQYKAEYINAKVQMQVQLDCYHNQMFTYIQTNLQKLVQILTDQFQQKFQYYMQKCPYEDPINNIKTLPFIDLNNKLNKSEIHNSENQKHRPSCKSSGIYHLSGPTQTKCLREKVETQFQLTFGSPENKHQVREGKRNFNENKCIEPSIKYHFFSLGQSMPPSSNCSSIPFKKFNNQDVVYPAKLSQRINHGSQKAGNNTKNYSYRHVSTQKPIEFQNEQKCLFKILLPKKNKNHSPDYLPFIPMICISLGYQEGYNQLKLKQFQYYGYVKNGKFQKNGIFILHRSQLVYEGNYKEGKAEGYGKLNFRHSGVQFQFYGHFANNMAQGDGVLKSLFFEDKALYGTWKKNCLIFTY